MADDLDDSVIDVGDDDEALTEPVFLIEHDGKYYLTVAIWGYDDSDPTSLTQAEREGVEMVRRRHQEGCKDGHHKAIRVDADFGSIAQHTSPPH